MTNGLFSLIKYGLHKCHYGFGGEPWKGGRCRNEGNYDSSWGKLDYAPEDPSDSQSVVDELSTLLTSGRLNTESRSIIKAQYDSVQNKDQGLRLAQQLIAASPEFHSTNLIELTGIRRPIPEPVEPSTKPFKAVVFVNLKGASDSYNFIVPHSQCSSKDMYAEYAQERGIVALSKSSLHQIGTGGMSQVCNKFGIHPDLPALKTLYDDNDLSFFTNVGVLFEYVNKDDWDVKTPTQLFAHNIQQRDIQTVDPNNEAFGTGVLGRMADVLTSKGYMTGSYSIGDEQITLNGEPQKSPTVNTVSPNKMPVFNVNPSTENMHTVIADVNGLSTSTSGVFGKTWSNMLDESVRQNDRLREVLGEVDLNDQYPDSWLGQQLATVSSILQMRDEFGQDRQFFYVETGGWDTHLNQPQEDQTLVPGLNAGLNAFVTLSKTQGIWDDIVVLVGSEFGRTFTPNSASGTDHGWGGKNSKFYFEYLFHIFLHMLRRRFFLYR